MTDYWVYVGGTFDLFHPGHVRLLQGASVYGPVVASVNTDEFAEAYKRRPVMSLDERMEMVKACRYVTHTVVNEGGQDSTKTIDQLVNDGLKVRWIVHGDDWRGEELKRQMGLTEGWMAANYIKLLYLPYTPGVSSSQIMERIRA